MAHLKDVIDSGGEKMIYDGTVQRGGQMGTTMLGKLGQDSRNLFESGANVSGYATAAIEAAVRLATGITRDDDSNALPEARVELAKALLSRQEAFQNFMINRGYSPFKCYKYTK